MTSSSATSETGASSRSTDNLTGGWRTHEFVWVAYGEEDDPFDEADGDLDI